MSKNDPRDLAQPSSWSIGSQITSATDRVDPSSGSQRLPGEFPEVVRTTFWLDRVSNTAGPDGFHIGKALHRRPSFRLHKPHVSGRATVL